MRTAMRAPSAALRLGAAKKCRHAGASQSTARRRGAAGWRATHFRRKFKLRPLGTFLACSTSDSGSCLGGRLRVVHINGAGRRGGGLENTIGRLVEEAHAARAMRASASAPDNMSLSGMPAAGCRVRILPSDMKGIVGEIVAEAVLVECGFGEPLYSKWRHVGTSASKGIDIVMLKGELVLASESKHLYALRPGRGVSSNVSGAIAAALRQCTDRRIRYWLAWLCRQCTDAARLGGAVRAGSPNTDALLRTAKIIDKALSDGGVSVNAVVVLDAQHMPDAGSIRRRIGLGALRGVSNPATAVASRIDGLRDATDRLIGRYC